MSACPTPRGGTPATPEEHCRSEIFAAGVSEPADPNYILGTAGDDDLGLLQTPANDVMCGFGGADYVQNLNYGDIFVGGDGPERIQQGNGGIFVGGAGIDAMYELFNGAFYGGPGNDYMTADIFNGAFYGGDGDDRVVSLGAGRAPSGATP